MRKFLCIGGVVLATFSSSTLAISVSPTTPVTFTDFNAAAITPAGSYYDTQAVVRTASSNITVSGAGVDKKWKLYARFGTAPVPNGLRISIKFDNVSSGCQGTGNTNYQLLGLNDIEIFDCSQTNLGINTILNISLEIDVAEDYGNGHKTPSISYTVTEY